MLHTLAFLYLLIPVLIFVIGWLNIPTMIVVVGSLLLSFVNFLKYNQKETPVIGTSKVACRKYIVTFAVIVIWILGAGIGGFIWQNLWDHKFRNAIFMDLVNNHWPVVSENLALSYYIGFWLPAALAGKIFGLEAGYVFQVIWAILGMMLVMHLLFCYLGAVKMRYVFIFIFFSGLDILLFIGWEAYLSGFAELWNNIDSLIRDYLYRLVMGEHLELACTYFNSSCNTTLVFWLYNQAIPFWVGFLLILRQKCGKVVVSIYALLLLFSPFPCVGLLPLIVYKVFGQQRYQWKTLVPQMCKNAFTVGNLSILPLVGVVTLYYESNIAVGNLSIIPLEKLTYQIFIAHLLMEFVVYLPFINREDRKDPILRILFITVLLCSFIRMGISFDFAWRTCIPLAFYIMLLIMKATDNLKLHSAKGLLLALVFCIGAVTPVTEMVRTIRHEHYVLAGEMNARSDSLETVFTRENNECYDNFIADKSSVFFQYLAKKASGEN